MAVSAKTRIRKLEAAIEGWKRTLAEERADAARSYGNERDLAEQVRELSNQVKQQTRLLDDYEEVGTSRAARVPCDLVLVSLREALLYVGVARLYTLTVHDSDEALLDARAVLRELAKTEEVIGRFNVMVHPEFARRTWRLTANDRCFFSVGE